MALTYPGAAIATVNVPVSSAVKTYLPARSVVVRALTFAPLTTVSSAPTIDAPTWLPSKRDTVPENRHGPGEGATGGGGTHADMTRTVSTSSLGRMEQGPASTRSRAASP